MTMIREHVHYYDRVFRMPEFLQDPVLVFGRHELVSAPRGARLRNTLEYWWRRYQPKGGVWLHNEPPPKEFQAARIEEVLRNFGARDVRFLDYFDPQADLVHDMNQPVPAAHHGVYGTLIDIGSIEHVFDTRQCLENMFRLVRVGGHIHLVTICKGRYNHGLHTFSPECLLQAFEINGFELRWVTYTTPLGLELDFPEWFPDVTIRIVARKTKASGPFACPQQGRWAPHYRPAKA